MRSIGRIVERDQEPVILSGEPAAPTAAKMVMRMSPLDISRSIPMASDAEFDDWLIAREGSEREIVVAIHKKASGKQTVTLATLQETALCHGWVDTQTKRIDDERYAIRFVPRRAGSTWSVKNRRMARRSLDEGRMTAAGVAMLPADL